MLHLLNRKTVLPIITCFCLIASGCFRNSNLKEVDFIFLLSFDPYSFFKIDVKNKTLILEQKRRKTNEDNVANARFEIKGKDTIAILYRDTFDIDSKELARFLRMSGTLGIDSVTIHKHRVADGGGFQYTAIDYSNDTTILACWAPDTSKEYAKEIKLLDAFYKLAYNTIDNREGRTVVESSQRYFPIFLTREDIRKTLKK